LPFFIYFYNIFFHQKISLEIDNESSLIQDSVRPEL